MSENVVAVRSIEIVTAEITMIRDNARKVFLESVIQIGTRLRAEDISKREITFYEDMMK